MSAREHLIGTALMAGIGALLLAFGAPDAGGAFAGGAAVELSFVVWTALATRRRAAAREHAA